MKPTKDHAYPVSEEHYEDGLTKLELISAMCLQGIMSNIAFTGAYERNILCEAAINTAKELLKQLEAENDTSN